MHKVWKVAETRGEHPYLPTRTCSAASSSGPLHAPWRSLAAIRFWASRSCSERRRICSNGSGAGSGEGRGGWVCLVRTLTGR